jgi:hypothetical protein
MVKFRSVRNKSAQQRAFLSLVKGGSLSCEEAVQQARLIPKALVEKSKVLEWPSYEKAKKETV